MLRDSAMITAITLLGLTMLTVLGYYFVSDYKQNAVVQGMTETIRASAYENTDNVSRVQRGELFIVVDDFEEMFEEDIEKNKNVKTDGNTEFEYEYLEGSNESIKAIRVKMDDGKQEYQATVQVDIAD